MTATMYYNPSCMLWDMQKTVLSYAEAHDRLTGSSILEQFMEGFDENRDGAIDYDENGRKGFWTPGFSILSHALDLQMNGDYGMLEGDFYRTANFSLKHTDPRWNPRLERCGSPGLHPLRARAVRESRGCKDPQRGGDGRSGQNVHGPLRRRAGGQVGCGDAGVLSGV